MNLYELWRRTEIVPTLADGYTDYKYEIENRLANPLFTSREKYNADHQSAQIASEPVLYKGVVSGTAGYRIPTTVITNSGTILIAAEHRTNPVGDNGDFSIDVARKAVGGSWTASEVIPFDSSRETYGSCFNPEFFIDRGTGRIYLFFGTQKENVSWWEVTTENGDIRYVYSDDDGVNWSAHASLKSLWDTDAYDYCVPSCTAGITLTNGTFVVPCMAKKGNSFLTAKSYSLLLIKPVNGEWYLSSVASAEGIDHLDECAVVEGTTANSIWLYCRPNSDYGTGVNRGYNKFLYNISSDTFTHLESSYFETNRNCCFGIDRIKISSQLIYLMSYIDSHGSSRENQALWGSLDGDKWIRIYRINKDVTLGYSVPTNYNGKIGVAYEVYDSVNGPQINYQDLTDISTLIYDSTTKYIEKRISVQDRMQMLFNASNGID